MKVQYERDGAKEIGKKNKEIGFMDESITFTHTRVQKWIVWSMCCENGLCLFNLGFECGCGSENPLRIQCYCKTQALSPSMSFEVSVAFPLKYANLIYC